MDGRSRCRTVSEHAMRSAVAAVVRSVVTWQATVTTWPCLTPTARAQRLSASEVSAPGWLAGTWQRARMCSTPFGIRGLCTRELFEVARDELVLNAFRHQRSLHCLTGRNKAQSAMCSTPFGIRGLCTPSSRPPARSHPGAQRLSASEVSAPAIVELAAIREYKCSTPFGIRGLCTRRASARPRPRRCAQRLSASEVSAHGCSRAYCAQSTVCSTPFGIRGLCTFALPWSYAHTGVLNAFRHQRSLHGLQGGT